MNVQGSSESLIFVGATAIPLQCTKGTHHLLLHLLMCVAHLVCLAPKVKDEDISGIKAVLVQWPLSDLHSSAVAMEVEQTGLVALWANMVKTRLSPKGDWH